MAQPYADTNSRIRTARRRPRRPAPPAAQGLYDPAQEHDACGVAFVADLHGRRSHDVVATGSVALCRLDHRGARGAEPNTGDGAGIMIQVPDEFCRAVVDFALPPAGRVRHRPGVPARPTSRRGARAGRCVEKYALVEGAELLGWRDVPIDPSGLGETALAAMPRIRQVFLAAHRLTDSPDGPAGAPLSGLELERVGVLRAQAGRAGDPRARRGGVLPVAVQPDHRLQGNADPRPAADVLPGPARRAGGQRDRAGPLPLLHEHVPVLAAGPPVPVHRPQRRDQHDPGQPQLDGGPRGAAAQRRTCPGNIRRIFPICTPERLRLGQLRRGAGAAAPGRAQPAARGADDDPGGVGERRRDGPGSGAPSTASTRA